MKCKACDKDIEDHNLDDKLELCNRCYGVSMASFDDLNYRDEEPE